MQTLDLLPFRLLLDRIVVPARQNLRHTLLPVAVPLAICVLILTLGQIYWMRFALSVTPEDLGFFLAVFIAFMGFAVLTMGVYTAAFGAMVFAANDVMNGAERPWMGQAYRQALRPKVFLALVLSVVGAVVSLLLFLVPALYYFPLLSLVPPIVAAEGCGFREAVARARSLLHWNPTGRISHSPWLRTWALLVVGTILNYAVSTAVQLPFIIAQQVILTRDPFTGPDPMGQMTTLLWLQVPAALLAAFATAATWSYTAVGLVVVYRELRRTREADDVRRAIDEMIGEPVGEPISGEGHGG